MYEARVIGVERVVGPMIESAYALHKFLGATKLAFPAGERPTTCSSPSTSRQSRPVENLNAMLELPEIGELDGVVLGRVDMTRLHGHGTQRRQH